MRLIVFIVFTYSLSSALYLDVWNKNYIFSFCNMLNRMQSGSFSLMMNSFQWPYRPTLPCVLHQTKVDTQPLNKCLGELPRALQAKLLNLNYDLVRYKFLIYSVTGHIYLDKHVIKLPQKLQIIVNFIMESITKKYWRCIWYVRLLWKFHIVIES